MNIVEWLKAILFGIVEGITEWLPVSSTGHMILLNAIMPLKVSAEFYEVFEVVIQLGAILAVVLCLWQEIWPLYVKKGRLRWRMPVIVLWLKVIVACVPAAIVGIAFGDTFDALFYNYTCVSIALIVFGVAILLTERSRVGKKPTMRSLNDLDWRTVVVIGLFQVLAAIFPGTSRSGATIVAALLLGVRRKTAAEFTFILAIPVMAGASLLKLVKYEGGFAFNEVAMLAVAALVAFVVSMLVVRRILDYVRRKPYTPFGWYRIALGAVVLVFGLIVK